MQLIEPAAVRKLLEDKKQWLTIHAIANGLSLNRNTVNKSLSGQRVTAFTARTIAKAAGVDVTEIARLVEN